MTTLLYVLSYAVGGMLVFKGLWRLVWYRVRVRSCTEKSVGSVIDVVEKRSLLAWPAMLTYYPIFEYQAGAGGTQILASSFPAQYREQIAVDKPYTIFYAPRHPARFYSPDWDKQSVPTGLIQVGFGLVILAVTLYTAFK